MVGVAKMAFDVDPWTHAPFLKALGTWYKKASTAKVLQNVPPAPADDVPVPNHRPGNPIGAAKVPTSQIEFVRDGVSFSLAATCTFEQFAAEELVPSFAQWLNGAAGLSVLELAEVKTALVNAAGNCWPFQRVLLCSPPLAAKMPTYVTDHPADAARLQNQALGSWGKLPDSRYQGIAYAHTVECFGVDNTPRIGDGRKRLSFESGNQRHEVVITLPVILRDPTTYPAVQAGCDRCLQVLDLCRQAQGVHFVDGGLFPKYSSVVDASAILRSRMMMMNGDMHGIKAMMAGIMSAMDGSGITEMVTESGMFSGVASAGHALRGGNIDAGKKAHFGVYTVLHGILLEMYLKECLDSDAVWKTTHPELLEVKASLTLVHKGGNAGVIAAAPGSVLANHLERYESYLDAVGARCGTAAAWVCYLRWVNHLETYDRLMHNPLDTQLIPAYAGMLKQVHILYCLTNRTSYAKIIAYVLCELKTMDQCFKSILDLGNGDNRWIVSTDTSDKHGRGRENDKILENDNADAKSQGGVTKVASRRDHLASWFAARPWITTMLRAALKFEPVTRRHMLGTVEIELTRTRSAREAVWAKAMQKVCRTPSRNPFLNADPDLVGGMSPEAQKASAAGVHRLADGVALPAKIAWLVQQRHAIGAERSRLMLQKATAGSKVNVFSSQPKCQATDFNLKTAKKIKVEGAANEIIGVLFFYLYFLVESGALKDAAVTPGDLLRHPLTSGGELSLFTPGGERRGNQKADWSAALLGAHESPKKVSNGAVNINDFFAEVRKVNAWDPSVTVTYGSLLVQTFTKMIAEGIAFGATVFGIAVDNYVADTDTTQDPLLKDQAAGRGNSKVPVAALGKDTIIKNLTCWFDFLKSSNHKVMLLKLILGALEETLLLTRFTGAITAVYVVVQGKGWCLKPGEPGPARDGELDCSVTEADAIVIRLGIVLSKRLTPPAIVFTAQDADIICMVMAWHSEVAPGVSLWIRRCKLTSVGERWWSAAIVAARLEKAHGTLFLPASLAAYAVAGCDTVEKLVGVGTGTLYKHFCRVADLAKVGDVQCVAIMGSLADLGHERFLDPATVTLNKQCARGGPEVITYRQVSESNVKAMEALLTYMCNKEKQTNCDALELRRQSAVAHKQRDAAATAATGERGRKKKKLPPSHVTPSPSGWEQHILRAHLQKEVWRSALSPDQPDSEPTPQGKGWVLVDREWRAVFSRLPPYPAALSAAAASAEDPAMAGGGMEEEGAEEEEEEDTETAGETEDEQDYGDADTNVCRETAMDNMAAASAAAGSDADEPITDEQEDSSEAEDESDEVRREGWADEAPKHRIAPATHASWMKVGARLAMKVAMFSHYHPQGSKDVWWLGTVTGGFGFTSAGEEWKGKLDVAYDSDGGSVQPWKPRDRWRFRLASYGPGPGDGRWVLLDDPANEQQAGKEQVKPDQQSKRQRKSTANGDYAYDGAAAKRTRGAPVAAASAAAPTAAVAHPSTKQGRRGGAQKGGLQPNHKPKRARRTQGGSKPANAK